jgi:hypothetical protein
MPALPFEFESHDAAVNPPRLREKSPERLRIETMLRLENAAGERLDVVAVGHRHRALRHDRPTVEAFVDEMHGAARDLHAGLHGLALRVETGKRR